MTWDPALYTAFSAERMRPFLDLMARVPDLGPQRVVDAGCGTGRTTVMLASLFPKAQVIGVDSSAAMLAEIPDGIDTQCADIATWSTEADLVVCNAVLHWIPEPARMLQHVASWVRPGGVLAVQVPANFDAPSHHAVRATAEAMGIIAEAGDHVLDLAAMARAVEPMEVDAWETTYLHQLSPEEILNWLKGTTLRPYLAAQEPGEFLDALLERLRAAYPDGFFPFTRRFLVARQGS